MMDDPNYSPPQNLITAQHATEAEPQSNRKLIIGGIIAAVVVVALFIAFIVFLLLPGTDTGRIRDVFIIFMAIESLLVGLVLVILIVQLARLTNLLQNEIKPILDSLNETISNLRGTSTFLTDNLVEPVMKMNEYMAGMSEFVKLVGLVRRRPKP